MDEPIADAAFITTYLVSKFARQDVTVILSGVGGDELFGGYKRYLDEHYRRIYHRVPGDRPAQAHRAARASAAERPAQPHAEQDAARESVPAGGLAGVRGALRRLHASVRRGRAARSLLQGSVSRFDDCIARAFAGTAAEDPLRRLMDVDFATQLPDDLLMLTDKMSMAVSLECRVPLLDQRLVELAARMPGTLKMRGGGLKHVMKQRWRACCPKRS